MAVKNKYQIEKRYISNLANRNQEKVIGPRYGAAHETANNSADADTHVRYFQNHSVRASYHQLVDSKSIIEIIPLNEKALHIQRQNDRQTLNLGKANDHAIAISLCRTGEFAEAYDRYVWAWAKVCAENGWDPFAKITAHRFEDPGRRSDPQSWLEPNGVTWNQFLTDVKKYADAWEGEAEIKKPSQVKVVVETGSENIIRHGDKGEHVKRMQKELTAAGFDLPRWGADGHFGDETEVALRAFQRAAGITVDGLFGPQSANALETFKQNKPQYTRLLRLQSPFMRGEDVKAAQIKLGVKSDGIYGPITERAVREYQRRHRLTVDGIVGPQTWGHMFG
ncbi:hypothetical protein BKP37_12640 [Anaerobacillus alkalilacustris]|uniref:N-acetylmuramoyl-L-alanine amidase n=1 Tax=Anaerobacillus alkalilacustris TaxID=393763 RepID=A0A1S2LMJ3_9BACI|nr:N-acetylmuramoyl-L-alanine amidase [Anaerobacillus alkalilacustris]OIJ12645.1 hypothetical protein BKP37_12640 [Anaerobacillus alkalilacustris]